MPVPNIILRPDSPLNLIESGMSHVHPLPTHNAMKRGLSFAGLLLVALLTACSKRTNHATECDQFVVVDLIDFQTAADDLMSVNTIELHGDCLSINFSAAGCDGESWRIRLIDAGFVLESNPPQRNLKFTLENDELCEAYITKEVSFDIRELRTTGHVVILNLNDSDNQILYHY